MAQKISENTEIQLDLKTIGMLVAGAVSLAAMYFTLQKDIDLAKELPKPEVSRTEYDLKDHWDAIFPFLYLVKVDVEQINVKRLVYPLIQ